MVLQPRFYGAAATYRFCSTRWAPQATATPQCQIGETISVLAIVTAVGEKGGVVGRTGGLAGSSDIRRVWGRVGQTLLVLGRTGGTGGSERMTGVLEGLFILKRSGASWSGRASSFKVASATKECLAAD